MDLPGVFVVDDNTVIFTTKVEPNVVPKVLGGSKEVLWGFEEEPPAPLFPGFEDSHYAKIPRLAPAKLPGIHSDDADFLDKETDKIYKKIYRGDFTLQTTREKSLGEDAKPKYTYHVFAVLKQESEYEEGEQLNYIMLETQDDKLSKICVGCANSKFSQDFFGSLNVSQQRSLRWRFWHFFLRIHGALLPGDVFRRISADLKELYKSNLFWKEALDVEMIRADIALSQDYDRRWKEYEFFELALLLKANKRYSSASLVHRDMIAFFTDDKDIETVSLLYRAAGDEAAAALEFEQGEELYIKALNLEFIGNNKDEKLPWSAQGGKPKLLKFALHFYNQWCGLGEPEDLIFQVNSTLTALLILAKASHDPEDPAFYTKQLQMLIDTIWCPPAGARAAVKPAYHNQEEAQNVLTKAVSEPCSAEKFHSTIMECSLLQDYSLNEPESASAIQQKRKDHAKELKQKARSFATMAKQGEEAGNGLGTLLRCGNNACSSSGNTTMMFCPCKMIPYCGKECQAAHWKQHKKQCPWQARKKAAKTGK